jgi:hypothetical protein
LEFLLIYSVMFRIILMNRDRLLVRCLFVLYVIYCPVMWVFNDAFQKYYLVYIIQSIILLIPSVLYFFEIFKLPIGESLTIQPAFWINLGILFFFSSTIPLFFLESYARDFMSHNRYLWAISYLAYGIFFLLISKAYSCKALTRLDYSLS